MKTGSVKAETLDTGELGLGVLNPGVGAGVVSVVKILTALQSLFIFSPTPLTFQ